MRHYSTGQCRNAAWLSIVLALLPLFAIPSTAFSLQAPEADTLGIEYLWDSVLPEEWQALGRGAGRLITGEPGELFIADRANSRILLVDLEGELLQEIGRSGAGPGEFREPGAISYDRDKKVLWVLDSSLQRCSKFVCKNHRYVYEYSFQMRHAAGPSKPYFAYAAGGGFWLRHARVRAADGEYRIRLYDEHGELVREMGPAEEPEPPWRANYWNRGSVVALQGGRVAYVWYSQPLIEVWDRDGELIIERFLRGPFYDMPPPMRMGDGRYGFPQSFSSICYDESSELLYFRARTPEREGHLFVGLDIHTLQEEAQYYLPEQGEGEQDPIILHMTVCTEGDDLEFFALDARTLCLVRLFPTGP